ncbi:helix-turn-helix domain-containing protein [Streptomyces sp. NPDC002589]|uniref:helix-turn-helix domain-containing protein n=1 Tax=Streptomyces sp. NPDC002589 TaxID=3154420 RepID=UPI0033233D53
MTTAWPAASASWGTESGAPAATLSDTARSASLPRVAGAGRAVRLDLPDAGEALGCGGDLRGGHVLGQAPRPASARDGGDVVALREQPGRRRLTEALHHAAEELLIGAGAQAVRLGRVEERDAEFAGSMDPCVSPLKYQEHLRPQETRRRLVAGDATVAQIAQAVGYASATQFNRVYRSTYGLPPGQDAARLRARLTHTPTATTQLGGRCVDGGRGCSAPFRNEQFPSRSCRIQGAGAGGAWSGVLGPAGARSAAGDRPSGGGFAGIAVPGRGWPRASGE